MSHLMPSLLETAVFHSMLSAISQGADATETVIEHKLYHIRLHILEDYKDINYFEFHNIGQVGIRFIKPVEKILIILGVWG